MENERFFGNPTSLNWESSDAHAQPPPELNSGPPSDQLSPPCFLNLNWDQSIDHSAHFESALSSLVSSPTSNPPAAESVVIRELIGRLGNICNSGEISPPSRYHSVTTSCYTTPLNSPPKLNLSMMDPRQLQQGRGGPPIPASHLVPFSADPGFAERAARFSCFGGGRNYGQFGLPEAGKLSRVSSNQSLKAPGSQMGASECGSEIPIQDGIQLEMDMRSRFGSRLSGSPTPDDGEFANAREESSVSDRVPTGEEAGLRLATESNARKRKAAPKGKGKEAALSSSAVNPPKVAEEEEMNAKRCRSSETNGAEKDVAIKPKAEQNGGDSEKKEGKETNAKLPEPPKDYIHVRARRGQATDSHSLAERVRREKISERMKFLQDLVPGCNKVTGKAVMLDEIINYVQSLQRQVEFLSMKLATVNPRLEFNVENIIPKEMNQAHVHIPPHSISPLDATSTAFSYAHQHLGTPLQSIVTNGLEAHYSMNPLDSGLRRSLSMQLAPVDGFGDATSQLGTFWEDDLQSVVHMGFGQNQEAAFSSQSFHGTGLLPTAHMKIEL